MAVMESPAALAALKFDPQLLQAAVLGHLVPGKRVAASFISSPMTVRCGQCCERAHLACPLQMPHATRRSWTR